MVTCYIFYFSLMTSITEQFFMFLLTIDISSWINIYPTLSYAYFLNEFFVFHVLGF